MMKLDVDLSEKRIDVKSCKALNFKKLIYEHANNVLTIILIQILEKMNFNSKNDASEIKKTAHIKSDSSILIFSKKTHMMLMIKPDLKTSKSD